MMVRNGDLPSVLQPSPWHWPGPRAARLAAEAKQSGVQNGKRDVSWLSSQALAEDLVVLQERIVRSEIRLERACLSSQIAIVCASQSALPAASWEVCDA